MENKKYTRTNLDDFGRSILNSDYAKSLEFYGDSYDELKEILNAKFKTIRNKIESLVKISPSTIAIHNEITTERRNRSLIDLFILFNKYSGSTISFGTFSFFILFNCDNIRYIFCPDIRKLVFIGGSKTNNLELFQLLQYNGDKKIIELENAPTIRELFISCSS